MLHEFWANAIYSVVPTILVGLIFWLAMRAIVRADRTERRVYADIEAEERAKLGLPPAAEHSGAAGVNRDGAEHLVPAVERPVPPAEFSAKSPAK